MNPLQYQLYRYSFWLAPLTALSFWRGVTWAMDDASWQWAAWWAVIVSFAILPVLDALCGNVVTRFTRVDQERLVNDKMLRAIPWICAVSWFATLAWALTLLPQVMNFHWLNIVGFVVSLGVVGGILAINVGHELIHRNNKAERFLGGLLLASVCYGVFKVEHVRGHHLRVATPGDPVSARMNESAYGFVPRAIFGTYLHGWRLERERLLRANVAGVALIVRNEVLHWSLLSIAIAGVTYALVGIAALVVLMLASLVAIIELELVDYIEHYGLTRELIAGAPEPVRYEHSWDYSGVLSNGLLMNLQRHSDHHVHGGRAFAALNSHPEAPQLPASYSAMLLAALIPPLYRRMVHPRILAMRST